MESKLSNIILHSNESWGADPSYVFEQYKNLPFAPFNKLEKITKFCDVSNTSSKPNNPAVSVVSTVPVDEEEEFHVVEVKAASKLKGPQQLARKRPVPQQAPVRQQQAVVSNKILKNPTSNRPHYNQRVQVQKTKFKENILVQADWTLLIEVNKSNFDKTPVSKTVVEDLAQAGSIPEYDRTWDIKIDAKKNVPFTLPNTISLNAGPRSDRFMLEHIEKNKDTDEPTVYITDALLSTLLTLKNSVFPWDLMAVKEGNQIFFEPNEKNKANYIDILTVNENTLGDLPEDEKELLKLCIESTNVNKKFIEITTRGTELKEFDTPNTDIETPDRKLYRYREWTLDSKIHVVVRSEVDAYVNAQDKVNFVKVCALNEFRPQQEWKKQFELNRGATKLTEIRNNLSKISKWLCQAHLADCENVKLGFVTKTHTKDAKHQVLAVEDMSLAALSTPINFKFKECWSILKTLVELLMKQEDGTFAFIKNPYKQALRIFRVPEKDDEEDNE